MSLLITGSIATDHLMSFPGRFSDSLVVDQLDKLSVSFLVEDLEVRRGGCAANICFGLGNLGLTPVLVGAVGEDFVEYRAWLERHRGQTQVAQAEADVGGAAAAPDVQVLDQERHRQLVELVDDEGVGEPARERHQVVRGNRPRDQ